MTTSPNDQRTSNPRQALRDYQQIQQLDESPEDSARLTEQPKLISRYYDAVTRFYEYGWGTKFHFTPRRRGESLAASQQRLNEHVGQVLRLKPGMEVADIGCGVGGPLLTIARATGATVTGINFNAHQIARGEQRAAQAGLTATCRFLYANYMEVPLDDGAFDAAYSFDAVCHAPSKRLLFEELHRLLKPGGEIALVDWCLTDRFDAEDARHRDIIARVEAYNATPGLLTTDQFAEAGRAAGFEIIEAIDLQVAQGDPRYPWYSALQGRDFSFSSWARTPIGRGFTAAVTRLLETLRLAPAGTSETAEFLNVGADALVESGELGIFTPSFLLHARKPNPHPPT